MREHTSAASRQGKFCRAYLRTMNPELAARESGVGDGFSLLETERVQRCLDRMREADFNRRWIDMDAAGTIYDHYGIEIDESGSAYDPQGVFELE